MSIRSDAGMLVVGDVMRDIIVQADGPFRRGTDQSARIVETFGGSAANQAVWLAAKGMPVSLMSRVGAPDCKQLADHFIALGVHPDLVADTAHATGKLVNIVEPDGERSFFTDRGANQYLCEDDFVDRDAGTGADLLDNINLLALSGYAFFSTQPRKGLLGLMARAKQIKIPIAIDPASSGFLGDAGAKNFLAWTKGATILLANEDEAGVLSGFSTRDEQLNFLSDYYDLVVIKLGAAGACAQGKVHPYACAPAPVVSVLDTTGAGDAFGAGFLASYLGDAAGSSSGRYDLMACLEAGVECGSRAVQFMGGQPCKGQPI